ncbi:MAG: hypothetical protein ACYC6Y_26130, partial [Thermoguttaceae bacterium]
MTVQLDDLGSTTGLDMVLHLADADGNLTEVDSAKTRVDYEATAGDRFYVQITGLRSDATVRVCNQVEPGTTSLTIHGSDVSDDLALEIDSPYLVTIHGIEYEVDFAGGAFVTTTFAGGSGTDSIHVLGGDDDDTAEINLATLAGTIQGTDFEVQFSSTAVVVFDGAGGHDTANIVGTDVAGQLNLGPFEGEIVQGAVRGSAIRTEEITIDAAGGNDHVVFDGGTKADRLDLDPTSGTYQEFVPATEVRDPTWRITATHIESNYASSGGAIDAVFMRDTPGNETFSAAPGL